MNLLTRKYNIKANIGHVFYCFSDFDFILHEIMKLESSNEINITKISDQELEFKGESLLFNLKQMEVKKPVYCKALLTTTTENLFRFGAVTITFKFTEKKNATTVLVEINNDKNPKLLRKLFVKIIIFILMLQSGSDDKQFIKAIEQSA